jgi:hypothetical protein
MTCPMRTALWVSLLASFSHLGCTREKSKEADDFCNLRVRGTSIQYNGQSLPLPGPLSAWEQVFGKHSRKVGVASDVYIWDDLGIYVIAQPRATDLMGFSVAFHASESLPVDTPAYLTGPAYLPRSAFKERLCVDGSDITSVSRIRDINQKKQGQPFARGYLDSIYSYDIITPAQSVYVRIDLTDDGTPESFGMEFTDKVP